MGSCARRIGSQAAQLVLGLCDIPGKKKEERKKREVNDVDFALVSAWFIVQRDVSRSLHRVQRFRCGVGAWEKGRELVLHYFLSPLLLFVSFHYICVFRFRVYYWRAFLCDVDAKEKGNELLFLLFSPTFIARAFVWEREEVLLDLLNFLPIL